MKIFTYLFLVSLLILIPVASIVGCGQPSAPPTLAPPAPTPPSENLAQVPSENVAPTLSPTENQTALPSPPTPPTPTPPTPVPTPAPPPTPTIVWTKPSVPPSYTVDESANRLTYSSGGIQVSGYFYKPQRMGPFPAVLVLHGRAGLGETHRAYASWLATQGYVALAPDYLTPVNVASGQWGGTDWEKKVDPVREHLALGVQCLKSLPYVAPSRIGIVGFSLGGFFGFILGTRDDVKGIVSYYGAYNGKPVTQNLSRYLFSDVVAEIKAPVLMFHGDADQLVPIALAEATRNLLESSGKRYEYIVYPGANHTFNAPAGPLANPAATADAKQRVLVFFTAELQ